MQKIHRSSVQLLSELDGEKNHPCASPELMMLWNGIGQVSSVSPPMNFLYLFAPVLVSSVCLAFKCAPRPCTRGWSMVCIFTLPCRIRAFYIKERFWALLLLWREGARATEPFFSSTGDKTALNIVPCYNCSGKGVPILILSYSPKGAAPIICIVSAIRMSRSTGTSGTASTHAHAHAVFLFIYNI